MHRVATSRRHLTGVLRRRPLLDWAVTVPAGAGPLDDLRLVLETEDAAAGEEGAAVDRPRAP